MDDIPLPDDIPTPDDDVSSMLITEQAENIEIVEYVTDVEIENVGLEDIYTQDDTVADMDIQANSPEATVDLPEDMFEIVQLPQTNDADITNEQAEGDQRTENAVSGMSWLHSIFLKSLASRLRRIVCLLVIEGPQQLPVPDAQSNQIVEGPAPAPENVAPPLPKSSAPEEVPSEPSVPATIPKLMDAALPKAQAAPEPLMQTPQTPAVDPMMQNAQMQYSAANYMYQQHMADPNMMSNYQYMTGNYSEYMSMYTPMQQQQYANTYASYQNYNYAYPAMQQMYDGRSMAQYAGGYSAAQMLPATPPLPAAQPVNNYNPPLPAEMSAAAFPKTPVTVTPKVTVDTAKALQVKKDEVKQDDKEIVEKPVAAESPADVEMKDAADVGKTDADKEPEKTPDDGTTDATQINSTSEDVNR